jgi:hypothetical protein
MAATYSELGQSGAALTESEAINRSLWHRVSWNAIFAGAVVGTAVTFFLLVLGAGIGLSLVPAHKVSTGFLTLGAIYFLAAQAMGFAVGGHIVGRLIGPMAETDREEEFRAAVHGLAVWGLCVIVTAVIVLMSGWVASGPSVIPGTVVSHSQNPAGLAPTAAAYWTDVLLRPSPTPMHASIAWRRYAQADTTANDASPSTDDEPTGTDQGFPARPMTTVPSGNSKIENDRSTGNRDQDMSAPTQAAEPSAEPHVITIPVEGDNGNASEAGGSVVQPPRGDIAADKAELGRIIEFGMANGVALSSYDRDRAIQIVAQDTGLPPPEAARRVDNARARIKAEDARIAETARKIARNASLWIAFALLFGAIVAAMAAISSRWEDDRITFGWRPRRSEPI